MTPGEIDQVLDGATNIRKRSFHPGALKEDSISIDVDFITDIKELLEFVSNLEPADLFFFGQFPARDNDGINAITITLPDADGVVRAHPH